MRSGHPHTHSKPGSASGTRRVALLLVLLVCVGAAIAVARAAFQLQPGLRAQYFATVDFTGPPVRTGLDPAISTQQLSMGWGFQPPDAFSAQWSGYLFVSESGTYTLQTTSDDGSRLFVDNQLVVDNGGRHSPRSRTGRVALDAGLHAVVLQYEQAGGGYELAWAWAREAGPLAPIPGWRLSPRPHAHATLVAIRWLDWIWRPLLGGALLVAGRLAFLLGSWPTRRWTAEAAQGSDRPLPHRRAALTLALFLCLTVAQTWPLATNPAHLSRNDSADTMLNEWTLAWNAHQGPRHPWHLFDGNMFYPERSTVAFSESLLVQSAMAAPLLWLGASPVLAYNIVLMAGFALTGWTMCLVVSAWTQEWTAGLAAGLVMAFNSHTLTRLPHLQAQHAEFLPLVLLSLDALLRRPRARTAIWLALWFVLQAMTSLYLLVFTAVAVAAAVVARPEDWLHARGRTVWLALALFAAVAAAALAPVLLPYWRLHAVGFNRSLDEARYFAARARDYATSVSRFDIVPRGAGGLFPGTLALVLAAIAVISGVAFRDARARMCLAFGVCGVVLSFGPAVAPGFETLYVTTPLLQGIRATSRFGYLGIVAVAVLSGYGVAWARRRLAAHVGWQRAATAAVLSLVFMETLAAPIAYEPFSAVPSIYELPASDPRAIVVEIPMAPPEKQGRDAPYLLHSTRNWRPLVNGYSGFTPPSYERHYRDMKDFPDRAAIGAMQSLGVTHVFVHGDRLDAPAAEAVEREPALHRLAVDGPVVLYRLDPAAPLGPESGSR